MEVNLLDMLCSADMPPQSLSDKQTDLEQQIEIHTVAGKPVGSNSG